MYRRYLFLLFFFLLFIFSLMGCAELGNKGLTDLSEMYFLFISNHLYLLAPLFNSQTSHLLFLYLTLAVIGFFALNCLCSVNS